MIKLCTHLTRCREPCPIPFSYFFRQNGYFHPFPLIVGRDENVSKMDVDSVDRRPGRRPVANLSLVDVDQENVCGVDVDRQRSTFIK